MSDLRNLSVEELQARLRETEDASVMEAVLDELSGREMEEPNVQQARKNFDEIYGRLDKPLYGEEKTLRRIKLGRGLLVACVLTVLVALVTVSAVGDSSLFKLRGQWVQVESEQMEEYAVFAEQEDGEISVQFFVKGTDGVTRVGAERITIWRKGEYDQDWVKAISYGQNTPGLWKESQRSYGNKVVYEGWPKMEYQVEIVVFAENGEGCDVRTEWVTIQ